MKRYFLQGVTAHRNIDTQTSTHPHTHIC